MQANYVIRKATTCDVLSIVKLWEELMDFHKERDAHYKRSKGSNEAFQKFVADNIQEEKAIVIVAEHGGSLVGYCQAMVAKYPPVFENQEYGSILDLAVSESYRRKGVGEKVVLKVARWFKKQGIKRIEVRFLAANEVSSEFWPKMGFKTYLHTAFLEI